MAVLIDRANILVTLAVAVTAVALGLVAGIEPGLAVLGALAIAFVLITFTDLAAGLALFTFAGFVGLHSFGRYDGIARMVLLLAWVALIASHGRRGLEFVTEHPTVTGVLGLFVGWSALSMVWAEDPGEAFIATEQWFFSAILLLITVSAIRTPRDLRLVLLAFFFGAIMAALIGIVNPAPEGEAQGARLSSAVLDPNLLAASLLSAAAIAIAVLGITRSPLARLGVMVGGTFCFIAVLLTGSRGGLIAGIVVLLSAVLISDRWRAQAVIATLALAATSVVFFVAFADDELRERVVEPTKGEKQIQEGRTTLWQVAWRAFEANPVKGLGAGNFRVSSRHYLFESGSLTRTDEIIEKPKVVHNAYLEVAAELGLVGLSLFVAFVAFCLACFVRAGKLFGRLGAPWLQGAAICSALALLGILSANFFISDEYSKQLWVLFALGPAMLSMAMAAERGEVTLEK
jgi:O-antigen ligase